MKAAALTLAASSLAALAMGQCAPCAVGDTCTVDPPFPAVCPPITPVGIVGVPYELDVTFWIPPSFPEPTTQLNVILQEVTVSSLQGVPLGLTYEASSPSLIYYPQQDPFGCVRICGTPMVAAVDTIVLTAVAQGTVGGVSISQNYSFGIPIQILGAAFDSIPDFLFAPDSQCAPMTVSFSETDGPPGMTTTFDWTFGNGSSFSGTAPPDQIYSTGGDYPVTLQRSFSVPMITQLAISSVSNAWCGDLDEPNIPIIGCVGQPDLYFTVTDSRLALWRSSQVNNTQSTTWNNLAIPLGFPPFTLRIYDKDELSADDLLGTLVLNAATGSAGFSQSGTTGSRLVQEQTVLTISYSDTVTVHPVPDVALSADFQSGQVCATPGDLAWYEWTLDGIPLSGVNTACAPLANGTWAVTATTINGCSNSASQFVSGVGLSELIPAGDGLTMVVRQQHDELIVFLGGRPGQTRIDVLDATGRVVFARAFASAANQRVDIPTAGLGAGCYVLRAERNGAVSARRLVLGGY